MAQKKYRADNTYIISTDSTDNPKLGAKALSDGRESLFLDFYLGYQMAISKNGKEYKRVNIKRSFLSLYLLESPKTQIERQQNKETLELAKKIRFEQGQELLERAEGYRLKKKRDVNFIDVFQTYIDNYTKKDIRMLVIALRRFIDFMNDTVEYRKFANYIKPEQITKEMIEKYTEYLQSRSNGEGAKSIYARFKKVIKYAVEHDIILKNPCTNITIKSDEQQLKKEILSLE